MEMKDYPISNKKRFRNIFVLFDNSSKYIWCIPFKNKFGRTITDEFSKNIKTSKRKPSKTKFDLGKYFTKKIPNFSKLNIVHQCSIFTDKGPSIAEKVSGTICSFLKKPIFQKGNASGINELPLCSHFKITQISR